MLSTTTWEGEDIDSVTMLLPFKINGFTDFSCSIEHVLNAGEAVLGSRSLPPGMLHFPIGYSGRASSIVCSGVSVHRPWGQFRLPPHSSSPSPPEIIFAPTRQLDYELEVAAIIGTPSPSLGTPIPLSRAEDHIFGFVLLNDISARDIQALEMNPLGPLNGKSFATVVSPWVIGLEALKPYATTASIQKTTQKVAKYLDEKNEKPGYSMELTAELWEDQTGKSSINENNDREGVRNIRIKTPLCKARLESMYWTFRDMVAHQTVNGCPLQTGDVLATGTVSGARDDEHGCLLEMTKGGKKAFVSATGRQKTYLEDGDMIRLAALAGKGVGFGECDCFVAPAKELAAFE